MISCEKTIILQSGLTFLHMFYSFIKTFSFVFYDVSCTLCIEIMNGYING